MKRLQIVDRKQITQAKYLSSGTTLLCGLTTVIINMQKRSIYFCESIIRYQFFQLLLSPMFTPSQKKSIETYWV